MNSIMLIWKHFGDSFIIQFILTLGHQIQNGKMRILNGMDGIKI